MHFINKCIYKYTVIKHFNLFSFCTYYLGMYLIKVHFNQYIYKKHCLSRCLSLLKFCCCVLLHLTCSVCSVCACVWYVYVLISTCIALRVSGGVRVKSDVNKDYVCSIMFNLTCCIAYVSLTD